MAVFVKFEENDSYLWIAEILIHYNVLLWYYIFKSCKNSYILLLRNFLFQIIARKVSLTDCTYKYN